MQPKQSKSFITALLGVIFFLSGFSALLYQVAWQRMLGLFAGSDVQSATIIVGAYLSGIGIGSLAGSMLADRLRSAWAVRTFGLCELGIALFAFVSRWVFYDLLFLRLNTLAASPTTLILASFASLLIPTTLMGLSLPLLSRTLVNSVQTAPRLIGRLYAINTIGSASGALLSGWYLVGTFGFERAVYIGGALNAAVGLTALLLSSSFRTDSTATVALDTPRLRPSAAVLGWCLLTATAGFVAISLELVWFRLLSVLIESKAYTFAHMLAFVLGGYAIGSWLGTRALSRVTRPRQLFLTLQVSAILYTLLFVALLYSGYDVIARGLEMARVDIQSTASLAKYWPNLTFGYLVLPSLLLLPPNILLGFNFPITQRAVQTDLAHLGQRVGLIQVAGIAGNTAGSVITGLVLFNCIGTSGTLRMIAALGLCFMAVLFFSQTRPQGRRALALSGLGVGTLSLALVAFPNTEQFWARLHGGNTLDTLVAEDATGVSVIRQQGDKAGIYANGVLEGYIPFMPIHQALGLLPVMVHPHPQQVLIIGIGSTGTPYAAGANPATEHITAVEIIGAEMPVLRQAARQPQRTTLQSFFDDPRLEIVIGDGRRMLEQTTGQFDLIQADAIHPWRSYSGMLYSREFFLQAQRRLAPGGIMAQWAPTRRTINTFMSVFPYGINIGNTLLLGSNTPISANPSVWLARIADPKVAAYLKQGEIDPKYVHELLDNSEMTLWTPETKRNPDINTDLWPRDEYAFNNN